MRQNNTKQNKTIETVSDLSLQESEQMNTITHVVCRDRERGRQVEDLRRGWPRVRGEGTGRPQIGIVGIPASVVSIASIEDVLEDGMAGQGRGSMAEERWRATRKKFAKLNRV